MKRFGIRVLVGVGLTAASLWTASAQALQVVATTPDLASIAQLVGGSHVTAVSIAQGVQDPHYVEAKPSFIRDVNRADLLIFNGLDLEVGWLPSLIQGARNPKIQAGSPGNLDVSAGIKVLEAPTGEVDRSQGDVHPFGNPHYMLDPRNGLIAAKTIADRLSKLDPAHQADYRRQLGDFTQQLNQRLADWEHRLAPLKGASVVAYHKTWEYFIAWSGLRVIGYIEDKPGIPPTPKHVNALMGQMKAESVRLILAANYNPTKESASIAKRTQATLLVLPASTGGEKTVKTYFDLFEAIVKALEGQGKGTKS